MNTLTVRLSDPNPVMRYAFHSLKKARLLLRPFGPILRVLFDIAAQTCFALDKVVGWSYLKLWGILGIYWYDHDFDHLLGPGWNNWTERGILANRCIRPGDEVLDVACGDGSYSGNYYSQCADHVDAFDYDEKAIGCARRKHAKPNVHFFLADATSVILSKKYDVVLLFASIEHFTIEDGARLLQKLGDALVQGGVLLGSTPVFTEMGGHNDEHKNEFLSEEQLRTFLTPHFKKVELWCSPWPKRTEYYFECREPIARPKAD
jgi:SAM-dependent methyltransferase